MGKFLAKANDKMLYGLAIGLVTPGILGILAWYIMNHSAAFRKADLLLIGCVAVNLIWLKYFFAIHKENMGRGVISATFLCAFAFFIYKVMQEV